MQICVIIIVVKVTVVTLTIRKRKEEGLSWHGGLAHSQARRKNKLYANKGRYAMRLIDADKISFRCAYNGDCMADKEECKKCSDYVCDFEEIQNQPIIKEDNE